MEVFMGLILKMGHCMATIPYRTQATMHGKHGTLARVIYPILKVIYLLIFILLWFIKVVGLLVDYLITAAAEVLPTETRSLSRHDGKDIALAQNDFLKSSNGVAVSEYPSDDVDSERDEIHYRLQNLELDLSAALKTLRSRFDKVLSNMVCICLWLSSYYLITVKSAICIHFISLFCNYYVIG